jgi:hypothetical protein
MKRLLHRLLMILLLAVIPVIYCSMMTTPLSFLIPVNCPPESTRYGGLTCFMNGTDQEVTPWYRVGFMPSLIVFPGFTVIGLALAFRATRPDPRAGLAIQLKGMLDQGQEEAVLQILMKDQKMAEARARHFIQALRELSDSDYDPWTTAAKAANTLQQDEKAARKKKAARAAHPDPRAWLPPACPSLLQRDPQTGTSMNSSLGLDER